MPSSDQLYKQKCVEFEELNENFIAYQDEATKIIEEIQLKNKELQNKCNILEAEIRSEKEKRKMQINVLQKELELIKREKIDIRIKYEELQRNKIQLQNIIQALESQNRASNYILCQYEVRVEKTMEELAILQTQLEANRSETKEHVTRLKDQLRETQQQLYVLHLKHKKHDEESELRKSRFTSTSIQSPEQIYDIFNQNDLNQEKNNLSPVQNLDVQTKREKSFLRTMNLVKSLIWEIDQKTRKIRAKAKSSVR